MPPRNLAREFTIQSYLEWVKGEGADVDILSVVEIGRTGSSLLVTWRPRDRSEPR